MKTVDHDIGKASRTIAVDGTAVHGPDDVALNMPSLGRRILETLLLALVVPGIGLWLNPEDPFFMARGIPWLLMLAPLLVGIRYGTALALLAVAVEALLLGASLNDPEAGLWPGDALLTGHVIALCVVAVLCGELSAQQRRRLRQMHALNKAMAHRQESFVRHYHVLRVSHDQLVEHLAAAPFSLRDALSHLERQFSERLGVKRESLADVGNEVLFFIARHSRIQRAALIELNDDMQPQTPTAWLGAECELSLDDPMLAECISRRRLVTLRDMLEAEPESPVAAIPLVDVDGRMHGLVVVVDMPFIDFNDAQMQMLTVIGACLGDLIGMAYHKRPDLRTSVRQWVRHAKNEKLSSLVASITLPPELEGRLPELFWLVDSHRRGLDQAWCLTAGDGSAAIVILMPLSPSEGMQAYRDRMAPLMAQRLNDDEMARIGWHHQPVNGRASADRLLRDLLGEGELYAGI